MIEAAKLRAIRERHAFDLEHAAHWGERDRVNRQLLDDRGTLLSECDRLRAERDEARAELDRCRRVILERTGSLSTDGVDLWIARMLDNQRADFEHHSEHHVREANLERAMRRYVEHHGPTADHHADDCPEPDCEACAIDAAVNEAFRARDAAEGEKP